MIFTGLKILIKMQFGIMNIIFLIVFLSIILQDINAESATIRCFGPTKFSFYSNKENSTAHYSICQRNNGFAARIDKLDEISFVRSVLNELEKTTMSCFRIG